MGFDAVRFFLVMKAVCGVAPPKAECLRSPKREDIKYTCKSYCIKIDACLPISRNPSLFIDVAVGNAG